MLTKASNLKGNLYSYNFLPYDQLSDRNKDEYMKQLLEVCMYRRWMLYNFDSLKEILFWSTRHDSIAVVISKDNSVKCVKYYKTYKYDHVKKRYSDKRTDGKWINETGMSFGYTYKVFNDDDPVCVVEGVHDLITMELLNMNYICLESAQSTLENNRELRRLIAKRKVLWIGDNDEAGEMCYRRNIKFLRNYANNFKRLHWKDVKCEYCCSFKNIFDFVCSFEDALTPEEDFVKYVDKIKSAIFTGFNFRIRSIKTILNDDYNFFFQPTDNTMYSLPYIGVGLFFGSNAVDIIVLLLHYAIELAKSSVNKKMFLWLNQISNSETIDYIKNIIKWKYPNDLNLFERFKEKIYIVDDIRSHFSFLTIKDKDLKPYITKEFCKLKRSLSKYDILVFDSLELFSEDLDINDEWRISVFFSAMYTWAKEEKKCIIFTHRQDNTYKDPIDTVYGAGAIGEHAKPIFHVERINSDTVRVKIVHDGVGLYYYYPKIDINGRDVKIHK